MDKESLYMYVYIYIYMYIYTLQSYNRIVLSFNDNMNGPLEHYAMWNMSDRYEIYQIIYDLFNVLNLKWKTSVQFSSVTQSCLTLCDPMNCSTPGLPVHHQLPEFTQTHAHQVGHAIKPSHPLSSPSPPAPIPPSIRVFSNESILRMRCPKYWSFSFSIVPSKKSQGWSPSEWTGWISLQSKGLSRVFSNTTVQKHQFFGTQPSSQSTLTSIHDYWKNHSLD